MKHLFSLREKKALRIIVILTVVMRLALMLRSEERIFTRPFTEDSFYLYSTAEHFAKGDGFSVDGIQPTNGVQPLIIFFYAPLFLIAGFQKLLVLKLAFIWVALFDALSVVLLAVLIKRMMVAKEDIGSLWRSPPLLAAGLWATLYPMLVHTACGLETGLYSTLLIASLVVYSGIVRKRVEGIQTSTRDIFLLGVLLGFTVLARIDAAIFIGMICLYEVIKQKGNGVKSALVIAVSAFFVSSPWWWYNYSIFGHIMPQSGFAESLVDETGRNIWQALTVIADSFSVFFFLPKSVEVPQTLSLVWVVVVTGVIYSLVKITRSWAVTTSSYRLEVLVPLLLTCIVFTVYYVFFFSAPHFIPRYFQPYRIVALILAVLILPHIISWLQQSVLKKIVLYIVITAALLFSGISYGYYFFIDKYSDLYFVGKWAETVVPARVGMDQSGTAGFVASNIVNLDGKVNIYALRARQKHDIGEYVAQERFEYIADWQEKIDEITASAKRHRLTYVLQDSIGRVKIYKLVE
jgi:hypothetical protein